MAGRTALGIAAALWMGLALAPALAWPAAAAWLALALLLAALAWRAPRRTAGVALVLLALSVGVARGGAERARLAHMRAALAVGEMHLRCAAVVLEPPRSESGTPVALVRVCRCTPPLPRGARLRLRLPPACAAQWGDTVVVFARIEAPHAASNPGAFDALAAADAAHVLGSGRAFHASVRPARGLAQAPRRWVSAVRGHVQTALDGALSPLARELAVPLVLGDRSAMSPELDAEVRTAGLVHLIALSGLHVGWLAAMARGIAASLRGGPRARALVGALAACGFAALAGPMPSLLRAVAGECARAGAGLTGRAHDALQSLAVAALLLLLGAPGLSRDLAFQFSFAASAGILALTTAAAALAPPPHAPARGFTWATTLVRHALQLAGVTAAAQVATLPLMLARYHTLPWTSLLANVAVMPLTELLLTAAWAGGALEALAPGGAGALLQACEPLARMIRAVTGAAARVPLALLPTGHAPALAWIAAMGAVTLALALAPPRSVRARARPWTPARSRIAVLGAALAVCSWLAALSARPLLPAPGHWWLLAIDVGQGDALVVAGEDGWSLIDCGARGPHWDAGEGAVLPVLRWAGVRELRLLALTHDDGDHTGGSDAVRRGVRVRAFVAPAPRPGVPGPCVRFGASPVGAGDTLGRAPLMIARWPPRPGAPGEANIARRGDNAAALVLEVGGGSHRAWLMADADSVVEAQLSPCAPVALLKAGHHGSGSSSGAAFVARAQPERVVLSVGARNVYGHPDAGAVRRLGRGGAVLERTDHDGLLWYDVGPVGVDRLDWRRGEPWHARALEAARARGAWRPRAQP